MVKKEFRDTLRTLFFCSCLFLIVPIAKLLDWQLFHGQWELSGIWQPVFTAVVILFAAYSGISIFQAEKKDRALEYLFSLPLPKWKIITVKVVPRFLTVLLLVAAGRVVSVFNNGLVDGLSIVILFIFAVFMSLPVDSLLNGLLGIIVLNIVLYYSSLLLSYLTMTRHWFGSEVPLPWLSYGLPLVLLMTPLAAAFVLTVKNLDLKPRKWQVKPYLVIALPAVILLFSFIFVFLWGYTKWIWGR